MLLARTLSFDMWGAGVPATGRKRQTNKAFSNFIAPVTRSLDCDVPLKLFSTSSCSLPLFGLLQQKNIVATRTTYSPHGGQRFSQKRLCMVSTQAFRVGAYKLFSLCSSRCACLRAEHNLCVEAILRFRSLLICVLKVVFGSGGDEAQRERKEKSKNLE